jgi:hypothetical protein
MDSRLEPFITTEGAAFEHINLEPTGDLCPAPLRSQLIIDTVHDGSMIPSEILSTPGIQKLADSGALYTGFVAERDWGANMFASDLARSLGLDRYYRVNVARVIMDFNRFPGSTHPGTHPLERMAINAPVSEVLGHDSKAKILETYYDEISARMESALSSKLIKLAIHTYDEHNVTLTQRPEISILSRSHSYQSNSRMPFGHFDPMYPDVLAESSASRVLRDRIALTLERAGLVVEHNYPYCLPDGSIEIRAQVWYFFRHLQEMFEGAHPETKTNAAYRSVWTLLLNTNLRDAYSETLFSFLHRFRKPPEDRFKEFTAADRAYEHISSFLSDRPGLVDAYRNSSLRPSTLSIEIRKDLLWRFEDGRPVEPLRENSRRLARRLAEAVATYLAEDRNIEGHILD